MSGRHDLSEAIARWEADGGALLYRERPLRRPDLRRRRRCAACGSTEDVQPIGEPYAGFCAPCRRDAARELPFRELGGEGE